MAGVRTPLISGNWKMNHNHLEAIHTVEKLAFRLTKDDYARVDVSVHPPFVDLRSVQTFLLSEKKVQITLGAQHCHADAKGAFTGEVSARMLAKLDVKYVLAGHSERRALFSETDAGVASKAKAILAAGMTPIVCVGETLEQREAGDAAAVVASQVTGSLKGLSAEQVGGLVLAYEPVWAIGTGRAATADDAQEMCAVVRRTVADVVGAAAALGVRVQYGGSVKGDNAEAIMRGDDVDGLLVGGASLDADEFARIVTAAGAR